ncbi:MAG TPA: FecR domain-containing protein [Novosphingobium sp.]|nr:FecR domain-containing protein [Novosphingobium sp.]
MADDLDDSLLQAAGDWIVRASEASFSASDRRALQAWRLEDPRNERAFRELNRLWHELPQLDSLLPTGDPGEFQVDVPRPRARLAWGWGAAGLTGIAAAFALLLLPSLEPTPAEQFSTKVGQISEVTLSDGSKITLAPNTRLTVEFSDEIRRIRLTRGVAFFDVRRDAGRPFLVDTGHSAIRVVGTRFNVDREARSVEVGVVQGIVEVKGKAGANQRVRVATLRPGDLVKVVTRSDGHSDFQTVATGGPLSERDANRGGWRRGQLVYDNAQLGEIIDDVNRFYAPGVTASDPRLRELRVTASFAVSDIPDFLRSIDRLFPVVVDEQPKGAFRLDRAH